MTPSISSALRTFAANSLIDKDGAAVSTALAYKSGTVFGLKRYATRVMFGAIAFYNSSHLLAIDGSKFVKPVRLPPGRASRCTTPAVTGSLTCTNTVGVVRVVSLTATAMGVELASHIGAQAEQLFGKLTRMRYI